MSGAGPHAVAAELVATVVAVTGDAPRVLVLQPTPEARPLLPTAPFEGGERSLQRSLRRSLEHRTGAAPLYLEQLYTFADRDRVRPSAGDDAGLGRVISVGYLALAREDETPALPGVAWRDWYVFFPWEDRRRDGAAADRVRAQLESWAAGDVARRDRVSLAFAADDGSWDADAALSRYELLWEAGLLPENGPAIGVAPVDPSSLGRPMARDHRRILATAVARLRAKIRYRALVFELLPPEFTLPELQRTIEALAGQRLHAGNLRRLIAAQDLLEETGAERRALGRPARLYRFKGERVAERALLATRLPVARWAR